MSVINLADRVLVAAKNAEQRPYTIEYSIPVGIERVEILGIKSANDKIIVETDCGFYPPNPATARFLITAANSAEKLASIVHIYHRALQLIATNSLKQTDLTYCNIADDALLEAEKIAGLE
jgi:hypothetical protein